MAAAASSGCSGAGLRLRAVGCDSEGDLAAERVGERRERLARRPSDLLLVEFRVLAHDEDERVGRDLGEIAQARPDALGRLVPERRYLAAQRL